METIIFPIVLLHDVGHFVEKPVGISRFKGHIILKFFCFSGVNEGQCP